MNGFGTMGSDLAIIDDSWLALADQAKEMPVAFQQVVFLANCHLAGTNEIADIKNNVDGIKDGESLVLRRTATDAADARAVSVETTSGTLIGYVPRRYGAVMARLMDAGKLLSAKLIGRDCGEKWVDITVAIEMREV